MCAGGGRHTAFEARKFGGVSPDLANVGCSGWELCLWKCNLASNVLFLGFLTFAGSGSFSLH